MQSRKDELQKRKIAVLMGGWSSEREISLRSGNNVLLSLKRMGFDAMGIDVDRHIADQLVQNEIDLAFIALHGPYGEDGCIQGMLETMGIPYTGSGVTASAVGMDKILTKRVLGGEGIALPAYYSLAGKNQSEIAQLAYDIGYPLILKPSTEGSSIGIALIHNEAELFESVLELQKQFSNLFLEQFLEGRELTVGAIVLGGSVQILPYLELQPDNEFYDFDSKYTKGKTRFILSASVESQTREKIDYSVRRAIQVLGLKGVFRVDFIVDENAVPWLLEVNTIPGMTETSDIPEMAKAVGMDFDAVVLSILESSMAI